MKSGKKKFIKLAIFASFFFLCFSFYFFQKELRRPVLPVLGKVQKFFLVNSEGKPVSLENLKGKVWIADFFFTTCSGICPIMSKHMAALQRSFEAVPGVVLVSISVNPETDSSAILKQYAQKFKADTKKWYFLTGSSETITQLAVKSFKLGAINEPVFHSSYFSLVDRQAQIRGYYDGTKTEEINRLFRDAAQLLKEK